MKPRKTHKSLRPAVEDNLNVNTVISAIVRVGGTNIARQLANTLLSHAEQTEDTTSARSARLVAIRILNAVPSVV